MAQYIAAVATRIADSADAVARSLAPVDLDGADTPAEVRATSHGPARVAQLLQRSAQDIHDVAVHGNAFSLSDIPAYVDGLKNSNGVGIDDRKMLLEKLLVLMSRLPADNQFAKTLHVFVIDTLYKDLPHPPAAYIPSNSHSPGAGVQACPSTKSSSYSDGYANSSVNAATNSSGPYSQPTYGARRPYAARSAEGSGYSTVYPGIGAAGKPYARTVPSLHANISLPDAGLVFDELLARRTSKETKGVLPSSNPNAIPGHATLPPTNTNGFAPQPGGLSSLFFAFADLIIHSMFVTNHSDWSINDASSYLDLSPLYGSSEDGWRRIRRYDGTGRLWEDVFADGRVLFMPPNVPALLVLFCRNHNYIASKLLTINESGTYTSAEALAKLDEEDRRAQDDEIFSRSRLVNCGWFVQVILGDYIGAILGLVRDGYNWRLAPLAESREPDHTVSPRGQGNVVSIEFNLLYRWHAALSEHDTAWTEFLFRKTFGTTDFKSITVDQFQRTLAKLHLDEDVRKWTFHGVDNEELMRDLTGAFKDADIAALLQAATEAPAGALKARGIPEVLRVVEIMGIEQARQWGTATMNEFRKFMGLKPFATFSEWNSDLEISKTAELLYGEIDNLELYPGLLAEEAKPPIPGAGFCPGYTISRAILADAVALIRGDRFLTTDFTVYNLTAWGYQDCFAQENDGAYGGILPRLLYRTLPENYPARSSYARFPFMVPNTMRGYLSRLVDSPVRKYEFRRPEPISIIAVEDHRTVKAILSNTKEFESETKDKLVSLIGSTGLDVRSASVNKAFDFFLGQSHYPALLERIIEKLLSEKSISRLGSSMSVKYVDIVRDVINLAPVHFVATELLGLPLKTEQTPHGLFRDVEYASIFADISNYIFINREPYSDWVLREKSTKATNIIAEEISNHLKRLSGKGIISNVTDSLIQWYTGEDEFSDVFLSKVLETRTHDRRNLAKTIFACLVPTVPLFSKAVVQIVDFFLKDEHASSKEQVVRLVHANSLDSDSELYRLACEALRLNPPVSIAVRKDVLGNLHDGKQGQPVYLSIVKANLDRSVFGDNSSAPGFTHPDEVILGLEDYGLTSTEFFKSTIPKVLRTIFRLKDLQRVSEPSGTLKEIIENDRGLPVIEYLDGKSEITPFPVSLSVEYKL